jgi:hypothetical protein
VATIPLREDQQRKRAPSEIGYHRFKATFITMALDAGIPISVIQKIVGNAEVRVLLKHYHRPDKKTLSDQMDSKLPSFLTGAKTEPSTAVRARALLEGMNAENWQLVRVEVLKLLTPVAPGESFFWEGDWLFQCDIVRPSERRCSVAPHHIIIDRYSLSRRPMPRASASMNP